MTGSLITSFVDGHWKESKTKETTRPQSRDGSRSQSFSSASTEDNSVLTVGVSPSHVVRNMTGHICGVVLKEDSIIFSHLSVIFIYIVDAFICLLSRDKARAKENTDI